MNKPVHPGVIMRDEVLGDRDISVSDEAAGLGVSRVALSRVINEHERISPNRVPRLEEAEVGTARARLAAQTAGKARARAINASSFWGGVDAGLKARYLPTIRKVG